MPVRLDGTESASGLAELEADLGGLVEQGPEPLAGEGGEVDRPFVGAVAVVAVRREPGLTARRVVQQVELADEGHVVGPVVELRLGAEHPVPQRAPVEPAARPGPHESCREPAVPVGRRARSRAGPRASRASASEGAAPRARSPRKGPAEQVGPRGRRPAPRSRRACTCLPRGTRTGRGGARDPRAGRSRTTRSSSTPAPDRHGRRPGAGARRRATPRTGRDRRRRTAARGRGSGRRPPAPRRRPGSPRPSRAPPRRTPCSPCDGPEGSEGVRQSPAEQWVVRPTGAAPPAVVTVGSSTMSSADTVGAT